MSIVGIDYDKCTSCKLCYWDCPKLLYEIGDAGKISFLSQYAETACIRCGHCVAICPNDAILGNEMDDMQDIQKDVSISYDEMINLIRSRRSIRKFKPEPLSEDIIDKIMKGIRYAPTNGNVRTLYYSLISDQARIKELSDALYNAYEGNPMRKIMSRMKEIGLDPFFRGAPHVLVCSSGEDLGFHNNNAGVALTHVMLLAQTLGVGTCWIGYAQMMMNKNKDLLKIAKARGEVFGVLTLGYPNVKYRKLPSRTQVRIKKL
jgi:nitroreductase/NAD-dependent dihydropyrimidine dehydrogenase PreA subunit